MRCKHCGDEEKFKAGFVRGQQRYRCKGCGRYFTDTPPRGYPEAVKRKALALYGMGLSYRAIGRLLGVSQVSIQKWLEALIPQTCPLPQPAQERPVVLELDEMWHYLKKSPANSGSGRLSTSLLVSSLPGFVVIALPLP